MAKEWTVEDELLSASLRRSDRIKTIETTKQQNKEMEIAEKLKRHRDRADSASNMNENTMDSSQSPHDEAELAARLGCKRLSENNDDETNMEIGLKSDVSPNSKKPKTDDSSTSGYFRISSSN